MSLFEPVFSALNGAGARYVVVGGLAVARPQDLSDIEALEALKKRASEKDSDA